MEQRRARRARSLQARPESHSTEERKVEIPMGIVDGRDVVNLDECLKDPEMSWNSTSYRRDVLPGMPVPPDRNSHEAHVYKLNCYTQAVSREPGVLESAVLRKLGIPELSDDLSDEGLKDKELLS